MIQFYQSESPPCDRLLQAYSAGTWSAAACHSESPTIDQPYSESSLL